MKNKVSIITPSYNDSETLKETLDSVFSQNYDNWQMIIVDDGSTDDTKKVISDYKKKNDKQNKIIYIYQENKDQLNAIKNGLNYADGEYILILHSDDVLANNSVLKDCIEYMNNNSYDAIISDHLLMNEKGEDIGSQKVLDYQIKTHIPPLMLLWLGRNLYVDTSFCRKEVYVNEVYNNYLTWNMPFWLSYKENPKMLNVKTVDFPFIKYRIHQNNYINNELGKLNVINGEIRVVSNLLKFYYIPFYNIQFYLYRIFNKIFKHKTFRPLYFKKEGSNKYKFKILKFVINKRFNDNYNNVFFESLLNFFKNYSKRKITIKSIDNNDFIYYGSDLRKFNKDIKNNTLSNIYKTLLKEMKKGFNEIMVSEENYEKIVVATKFLSIYPHIKINKIER